MTIAEPSGAFAGGALAGSRLSRPGTGGGGVPADGHSGVPGLSGRLTAVARMIQIGSARAADGFSGELLRDAEGLLARAGQRLRMSGGHTVVVLAGGTGSGKSSLFNQLAGADFSPSGVVRPMTRKPYACVWGMEGAGPLLEWLGVEQRHRYARSSALDDGERSLAGLLLLDLPDHDSVLAGTDGEVNRLVSLADLMVWVLDPQKYADAAVHSRYLVPMAGHVGVIAVALNQADLLSPEQVHDCVSDLQRLLDSEGLHDVPLVVTSAATGAGVGELRKLLVDAVLAREAAEARIAADVDALAARFAAYGDGPAVAGGLSRAAGPATAVGSAPLAAPVDGPRSPGEPTVDTGTGPGAAGDPPAGDSAAGGCANGDSPAGTGSAPAPGEQALVDAFARAAGVKGVGSALQSARELRAVDYVGWPVAWLTDRLLRRDPVRKMRLGNLWDELRGVSAGPGGAQAAEIDNAVTALADTLGRGLPGPWPVTVRRAARSRMGDLPASLGEAVAQSLPTKNRVSAWWRLVAAWQGLLLGGAVAGLAWLATLLVVGVFHTAPHASALLSDVGLMPWAAALVIVCGGLGWLTGIGCMSLVGRAAVRERAQVEARMRSEIGARARQMVMAPAEQELAEHARFRDECATARGAG